MSPPSSPNAPPGASAAATDRGRGTTSRLTLLVPLPPLLSGCQMATWRWALALAREALRPAQVRPRPAARPKKSICKDPRPAKKSIRRSPPGSQVKKSICEGSNFCERVQSRIYSCTIPTRHLAHSILGINKQTDVSFCCISPRERRGATVFRVCVGDRGIVGAWSNFWRDPQG